MVQHSQPSLLGKLAEIVMWFRVVAGKPVEGQNVGSSRRGGGGDADVDDGEDFPNSMYTNSRSTAPRLLLV